MSSFLLYPKEHSDTKRKRYKQPHAQHIPLVLCIYVYAKLFVFHSRPLKDNRFSYLSNIGENTRLNTTAANTIGTNFE